MSVLLERIRGEIGERLQVSRAAVEEYTRLKAALAALGGSTATRSRPSTPPAERSPRAKRAASTKQSSRQRAARGANREAVLRVIRERPAVSATELAAASGVERPVLYALL